MKKRLLNVAPSLKRIIYALGLMLLMLPAFCLAQAKTITGVVKDDNGNPLSGATVQVKATKSTTKTDAAGRFAISSAVGNVLVVSFTGYDNIQVKVGEKNDYTISLKEKTGELSDVVVVNVGYGSVLRKDVTGSVGSVNMKDLIKAPVKSFDDALAGRVAGVQVQSSDGQPGSNANIIIRGAGSISQDNSPLYVVDGFPTEVSNANSISPDDIESIDVLKDASATAIYGARGSNGVIVITTKKGKSGPPQLTYSGYYGLQATPKKMKLMDAYNFVKYVGEVNKAIADSVYLTPPLTLNDYKNAPSLDLQDNVFHTGLNQSHEVSIRGGDNKTKYSISGNFNDQGGIIINGGFKRYQGRFVLDQVVSDKFKAGVNANYAYTESYGIPVSATNFYASSTLLYSVWGWRPTSSVSGRDSSTDLLNTFYDPENEIGNNQDYRVNPYVTLQNQITSSKTNNLTANAYAEYSFSKKLKLRVTAGINTYTSERDIFNNSRTQSGSKWTTTGPNGSISTAPVSNWLNENMLTYTNTFGKDHHLNVLVDFSEQGNKNSYRSLYAAGLPNEDLGLDGLDLAPAANTSISVYSSRWTMASALARVNYDYKSKYLFTASMRGDGSSKFFGDNRWGYFPSGAFAWHFSNENFMQNVKAITDAKLRISYGTSGNNRVTDFAYLPSLDLTQVQYYYSNNGQVPSVGAILTSAGNYNLKWETGKQTDIGLDLSFFNDRITLATDVYKKVSDNLLLNASLPSTNGVTSFSGYENVGSMQNQGLEITLNTINVQKKDISWSSSFNISFNQNKIISLAPGQVSLLAGSGTFFNTTFSAISPYISVIGQPMGQMYGYIFNGVYQYSDFDLMPNGTYLLKSTVVNNGAPRAGIKPGDIKYKDINGDGIVDSKDYTIIGSGQPKYVGGFSNNFRYKNLDLNVFFQYSVGNDVINANRYVFEGGIVTNPNLNQFASYENRWEPDNPSNTIFRAGGMTNAAYSSRVVEDGSYLKLRTVSLGYTLPKSLLKAIGINNLRAYATAQNILTITKYSGQDPEVSSRQSNLTPGFDYAGYPHSLSLVFGLNATF